METSTVKGVPKLGSSTIRLDICDSGSGRIGMTVSDWGAFRLEGMSPALKCDGAWLQPTSCIVRQPDEDGGLTMECSFSDAARLTTRLTLPRGSDVRIRSSLLNTSGNDIVLNEVILLGADSGTGEICFGTPSDRVSVLEQSNYRGRVRSLAEIGSSEQESASGEPNAASDPVRSASELFSVVFDSESKMALLTGFLSSERWLGRVRLTTDPDGRVASWNAGFDGGDLPVRPHEEIPLEELSLSFGNDPWVLMEQFGDAVAERRQPSFPARPPVSWCSWYPYRLGVTEERVLENARIAVDRLKPLGLEIFEVDLGWQAGNLPSSFEENERFPHGLAWLADGLGEMGFSLGVWTAPYTISEFDQISSEHPEWLVCDPDGKPLVYWDWFWEPHGNVFILDLTHPGARGWLGEKVSGLHRKGVRYLKCDFIGCVSDKRAKARHDQGIVAGGGCEAARLGAQTIREALPDGLLLNCGGPEMPGTGQWPLFYSCDDTGNTGFISHPKQRANYETVACHLFKNKRWGILQPSCLCAGLPGTIEDARLRATVAFLAGGQIDISDDLTTLPEDRWSIITASLPSLGRSATPVDLFEPVYDGSDYDYSTVTTGAPQGGSARQPHPPGSVWHVHVTAGWDEWDLVGVFSFESGASSKSPKMSRFSIPLATLGIPGSDVRWGYEFWSGQFLATIPGGRTNPAAYSHPGDFQELKVCGERGAMDLAFFGPGVKLLCLRKPRNHPWVSGTTFHQSCGAELEDVVWNSHSLTLSGTIRRPRGESGAIVVAPGGMTAVRAEVDGREAPTRTGANSAVVLPLTLAGPSASWSVRFDEAWTVGC